MSTESYSLAFSLIADLAIAKNAHPMKKHAGCWEHRVDEHWEIAVNGHSKSVKCSHGADVPPYECYIQFNGWPAGIINPFGGVIAAGSAANEESFIAALRAVLSGAAS